MNAIHHNLSPADFGTRQPKLALTGRRPTTMVAGLAVASVMFAALLIAYVAIRTGLRFPMPALPWIFWPSTAVLLASSLMLQDALRSARRGNGNRAHRSLLASTALSFLFVGLQAPGIVMLGQLQMPFRALSPALYGLTLALIGLHLLMFVGGVAALSEASWRSEKHHYEVRESNQLRPLAAYCHAITAIWLMVFAILVSINW